jgi:VanZ family protein
MPLATYRRSILAAYVAAVLFLMLAPLETPRAVARVPDADKIVHAALFGVMAGLIWWNLGGPARGRAVRAVVLATVFASLIEVIQCFIPYRSADALDALAGLLGATVGALAAVWLRRSAR